MPEIQFSGCSVYRCGPYAEYMQITIEMLVAIQLGYQTVVVFLMDGGGVIPRAASMHGALVCFGCEGGPEWQEFWGAIDLFMYNSTIS